MTNRPTTRKFLLALMGYSSLAIFFVLLLLVVASEKGQTNAFRYVGF